MNSFSVLAGKSGGTIADQRRRRHDADAGKILHRIERHGLVDRARDGVAVGGEHQRVAVWRAVATLAVPGRPGRFSTMTCCFHSVGELVGQDARKPVGDAAGGERNHDRDRLGRIVLRERAAARGQQGRNAKSE